MLSFSRITGTTRLSSMPCGSGHACAVELSKRNFAARGLYMGVIRIYRQWLSSLGPQGMAKQGQPTEAFACPLQRGAAVCH